MWDPLMELKHLLTGTVSAGRHRRQTLWRSAQFSTAEPLPQELLRALNHYLDEFDPRSEPGMTHRADCLRSEFYPGVNALSASFEARYALLFYLNALIRFCAWGYQQ
jgi:hypothetical protein